MLMFVLFRKPRFLMKMSSSPSLLDGVGVVFGPLPLAVKVGLLFCFRVVLWVILGRGKGIRRVELLVY